MKKTIIMVYLMILSLGISSAFAAEPDKKNNETTLPGKTENKLTEEEISRLTRRVEEIRDIAGTDLTSKERKDLKKELKEIKATVKADGGYIYIGAGTLLVIILLVILLL